MTVGLSRTFLRSAFLACFVALILSGEILAQAALGSLHGTVTDPSGAAVTKADVQITAPDGKVTRTATNQTGSYDVKGLAAGKYGIKVTAKGFAVYEVDGIEVGPGQSQKMDVALSIETQQENVNVSEQAVGLDTSAESNATQMVLTGKDLDALSDDPDELADDLQALAGPSAGPNGGQIYIDGFTGGQLPPKSSIREIRINQNPFSRGIRQAGIWPHRDFHEARNGQIPRANFGPRQLLVLQLDEPVCDKQSGLRYDAVFGKCRWANGKEGVFLRWIRATEHRRQRGGECVRLRPDNLRANALQHVRSDAAHHGPASAPEQTFS